MLDEKEGVAKKSNTRCVIAIKAGRGDTDHTDLAFVRIVGIEMRSVDDDSQLPEQQGDQAETYRHFPCGA